jgi:epoxyqueuosine reductase QueG
MTLDERYRQLARTLGTDFYSVADLAPAHEAIVAQGGELAGSYPRAISVGVRLMDALVDQLPQADDIVVVTNYRHHGYDVVNRHLDELVSRLASTVQADGYCVWPVPTTGVLFPDRLCAFFSHKLAAHLAGLAWIGKSCLAVTPEAGPRVRWGTLLTDAPLSPGTPLDERCGSCRECVDICPARAFTGRPFHADEPREARYDAHACNAYQQRRAEETGLPILCGLCLYACPHGRRIVG